MAAAVSREEKSNSIEVVDQIIVEHENRVKQQLLSYIKDKNLNELRSLGYIYHPLFLKKVVNLPLYSEIDPRLNKDKEFQELYETFLYNYYFKDSFRYQRADRNSEQNITPFMTYLSHGENTILSRSFHWRIPNIPITTLLISYGADFTWDSFRNIYPNESLVNEWLVTFYLNHSILSLSLEHLIGLLVERLHFNYIRNPDHRDLITKLTQLFINKLNDISSDFLLVKDKIKQHQLIYIIQRLQDAGIEQDMITQLTVILTKLEKDSLTYLFNSSNIATLAALPKKKLDTGSPTESVLDQPIRNTRNLDSSRFENLLQIGAIEDAIFSRKQKGIKQKKSKRRR